MRLLNAALDMIMIIIQFIFSTTGGVNSVGRTYDWDTGGPGFDSQGTEARISGRHPIFSIIYEF